MAHKWSSCPYKCWPHTLTLIKSHTFERTWNRRGKTSKREKKKTTHIQTWTHTWKMVQKSNSLTNVAIMPIIILLRCDSGSNSPETQTHTHAESDRAWSTSTTTPHYYSIRFCLSAAARCLCSILPCHCRAYVQYIRTSGSGTIKITTKKKRVNKMPCTAFVYSLSLY